MLAKLFPTTQCLARNDHSYLVATYTYRENYKDAKILVWVNEVISVLKCVCKRWLPDPEIAGS